MNNYFHTLKVRGEVKQQERIILKNIFARANNQRLRKAFWNWKIKDSLTKLSYDLYHTGPVRVQEWKANQKVNIMAQFLREEGYTEDEVNGLIKRIDQ